VRTTGLELLSSNGEAVSHSKAAVHGTLIIDLPVQGACMSRNFQFAAIVGVICMMTGCTSVGPLECPTTGPATALAHYDQMTASFLDENTKHPSSNLGGGVVWNTRWYLESLVTAYQATGNTKYADAFKDSGTWVLNMVTPMTLLDVSDPSAPGQTATRPTVTVHGWPTHMATFGQSAAVPTADGKVSFYAQSLYPRDNRGPIFVQISAQPDGSLLLAWIRAGVTLPSYTVRTTADLNSIAAQPLIYGQTPARLKATGLGLPAVGSYEIDNPLQTIWHAEQTGGILNPFANFLLLAKANPSLIDPGTASTWEEQILSIASEYVDEFAPDGSGGLTLQNAQWMASSEAGTVVQPDYVFAEANLRLLLYELTSDPKQLAYATGLMTHQVSQNWQINSQGWILLKNWPDIRSWSSRSQAPPGTIWDSLTYDPSVPEYTSDTVYLSDLFQTAKTYSLSSQVGLPDSLYDAHSATFREYIRLSTPLGDSLLRANYPTAKSNSGDQPDPATDLFEGVGFLYAPIADPSFVAPNWANLLANGTAPEGDPVGYFLLAWARAEAAFNGICQSQ